MKKKRIVHLVLIVIALMGLFFNTKRLNQFHRSTNLNRMINNAEIPLSLSITTFALGPLRALIVDSLWWRAIRQQDRGEYFDALQLADWITKMQPTYASVWAFHGWNMSYNVAHDFTNKEDRWQWILRALQLLRNEGLRYNPDNTIIRHELARIFFDRIGSKVDPDAEYFKNQWAFKMMQYFSSGTREELERLSQAASSLQELQERPYVKEYAEEAANQDFDVFNFTENIPRKTGYNVNMGKHIRTQASHEIFDYYKRFKIERDLKLDIKKVLEIDRRYGPFDWRLHQAHTIYWAAEDNFEDFMKGGVNYAKIVRQSMMESFYEGRLFHNPVKNVITRTNNLQIIGKIHDYVEYLLENQFSPGVDKIHKDFLDSAIAILYTFNQHKLSRQLFEHYKEDYLKGGSVSYEIFIMQRLRKTLANRHSDEVSSSLVEAAIYQSFEWLDLGEYDRSNGYYNFAKLMWQSHQNKHQNNSAKLFPPFDQILQSARERFLNSSGIEENVLNTKIKRAETKPPEEIYIGSFEDNDDHAH